MIDRLVHHAEVVALGGDSYRFKNRDIGRVPPTRPTPTNPGTGQNSIAETDQISVAVDTIQVPRSNQAAEYRQAGEVTPMFSSWMPESGHLDADLRVPRFDCSSRPAGDPS
jgi:hypothetical protein